MSKKETIAFPSEYREAEFEIQAGNAFLKAKV